MAVGVATWRRTPARRRPPPGRPRCLMSEWPSDTVTEGLLRFKAGCRCPRARLNPVVSDWTPAIQSILFRMQRCSRWPHVCSPIDSAGIARRSAETRIRALTGCSETKETVLPRRSQSSYPVRRVGHPTPPPEGRLECVPRARRGTGDPDTRVLIIGILTAEARARRTRNCS
jgi:hypothetical protein